MEYNRFRVRSPVKSFRDLEVYQKTIQLSSEITSLPFLDEMQRKEMAQIAEQIPKLMSQGWKGSEKIKKQRFLSVPFPQAYCPDAYSSLETNHISLLAPEPDILSCISRILVFR